MTYLSGLFLGGFAEHPEGSAKVNEIGGLDVVVDAMDWYRFHEGVCKWALWAGFHLCYDRHEIQSEYDMIG
jgi:hypothetical protein